MKVNINVQLHVTDVGEGKLVLIHGWPLSDATLVPREKSGHALYIRELDKFNTELINFIENGKT